MESQVVRRRVNVITGHLACREDASATVAHVFPMKCSNNVNYVFRRFDNVTFYARQGSGSQGCFMRQASSTELQENSVQHDTHLKLTTCGDMQHNALGAPRFDSKTYFARQGSGSQGCFMRQASCTEQQENFVQHATQLKSTACGDTHRNALDEPVFARPAQGKPGVPTVNCIETVVEDCRNTDSGLEAPMFARPSGQCEQRQVQHKKNTDTFPSKELEWSPKMDVVESGFSYVVTLEIPGINIDNIKVEVNNQSLIVTGNRPNWSCGAACSDNSDSFYHRREILQGPYRVVWQLPNNANKESVSAEIQDGLLLVTIPKRSALIWLRKAHM